MNMTQTSSLVLAIAWAPSTVIKMIFGARKVKI